MLANPATGDPRRAGELTGARRGGGYRAERIYFLAALVADLVTLPEPATAFSTALMTPTATV